MNFELGSKLCEVYTGRRNDAEVIDNLGVTGNLVIRMTVKFSGQNYSLYADRFYTSVQLIKCLIIKLGITMCGTTMTNIREFPKTLIRRNNEMQNGESEIVFNGTAADQGGQTLANLHIAWQDKQSIYGTFSQKRVR